MSAGTEPRQGLDYAGFAWLGASRSVGLQIVRRLMASAVRGWQRPDVAFGRVALAAQREAPQRWLAGCSERTFAWWSCGRSRILTSGEQRHAAVSSIGVNPDRSRDCRACHRS